MSRILSFGVILGIGMWGSVEAHAQPQTGPPSARSGAAVGSSRVSAPLLTASVDPHQFGTQDYTITVLSATQFQSTTTSGGAPGKTGIVLSNLSATVVCCDEIGVHYFTTLDLPAGAVIDFIGVNTATSGDAVMGFSLLFRDHLGGTAPLTSFSFPAHGFATDYAGPLGILIPSNLDRVFVLDVEQAPADTGEYFGYVEVWWRRVVSDPPATPTFGDVSTSHPFYQFVEALAKSGITGGCGGGNYCPDSPLTRGQMAVFLSKALGLHWPN